MTQASSVSRLDSVGGKNIATVTITKADGTVVHRQELVLTDPDTEAFRAVVTKFGELAVDADIDNVSRRSQEMLAIQMGDQGNSLLMKRFPERVSLTDRRGGGGRGSSR